MLIVQPESSYVNCFWENQNETVEVKTQAEMSHLLSLYHYIAFVEGTML